MNLQSVDAKTMTPEIFRVFGTQHALLTAGDRTHCNTMTIGWCQLGQLWSRPVCTVYVRPERYTFEWLEDQDYFTVSVLPDALQDVLQFCGTHSGRTVDKVQKCGLTVQYGPGDAPFFEEAEWVLVCKKIYAQDLHPDCVTDGAGILSYYGENGGWHRGYTGEVVAAYQRKS